MPKGYKLNSIEKQEYLIFSNWDYPGLFALFFKLEVENFWSSCINVTNGIIRHNILYMFGQIVWNLHLRNQNKMNTNKNSPITIIFANSFVVVFKPLCWPCWLKFSRGFLSFTKWMSYGNSTDGPVYPLALRFLGMTITEEHHNQKYRAGLSHGRFTININLAHKWN